MMGTITLDANLFRKRIWKLADKAEENAKKSLSKEFREDVTASKFVVSHLCVPIFQALQTLVSQAEYALN